MSILVVAAHDQQQIKVPTRVALAAAAAIGGDVDVLVAGEGCHAAADAAAQIPGVSKVLMADSAQYGHALAEEMASIVASVAEGYSHIIAATTTSSKNYMPRVAAMLDVAQISDIISVESPDTFKRPIYAGNAIATVQSADSVKVLTVRGTAFDPVPAEGGTRRLRPSVPPMLSASPSG